MDKKLKNTVLPIIALLGIACFYFFVAHKDVRSTAQESRIIRSDVQVYYSYLPATFIENDPFFEEIERYDSISKYWTSPTPTGKNAPKTTMGIAFLEAPFFFIGHQYAKNSEKYTAHGFSPPYSRAVSFATAFYGALGLILLYLFLTTKFSTLHSLLSVICIGIGTNLYFYSVYESGMSHAFTFCVFSGLLLLTEKWIQKKSIVHSFFIGILLGLIVLIRPINILFLLPMLFFYKKAEEDWRAYLSRLFLPLFPCVFIIIGGIFIWFPQLLFWKIQAGKFFYFSYPGETFFWLKPHVFDGLFSFRKGWFIYTPMMFLSVAGLLRLYRTHRNLFWGVISFLPLFIYITFSWWAWWYGGGFGARTLVDILPIMALPLTAFFEWVTQRKIRYFLFLIPAFFIYFNVFQSWQYRNNIIHYDGMTFETYKMTLFKTYNPSGYWEKLKRPDYEGAREFGEEKTHAMKDS